MNRVKVVVCGKEYVLKTEEDPSYVYSLAKELEKEIISVITKSTTISVSSASIMVAMSILDELHKNNDNANHLRAQLKEYSDELYDVKAERDEAVKECDILKGKLAQAEENLKLKKLRDGIKTKTDNSIKDRPENNIKDKV